MAPLWKVGLHVVCSCLWLWMLGISMELLGIPNVWRKMSSSHPLKIRDKWSKIKIPTVLGHFHFDSYFRIGFFTTTEVLFHAGFWGKVCCEKWTTEPTCKHCGTRTATTPENSGVFSTGVPCDSTDIFWGAYKVFETILAFALLKVALLICCAYLFFLKWGSFHQNQHWLLIFWVIYLEHISWNKNREHMLSPTNSDETLSHQTNVVTLCALHFFHPPCCIQKTSGV